MKQANFSGVAVLHGSLQQHIWSFVSGGPENLDDFRKSLCPCDPQANVDIEIPPSVGDDYFCESGYIWPDNTFLFNTDVFLFHSDDPLWDGDDCPSDNNCCTFNNPPYFTKYLDNPTTDDIELQLCFVSPFFVENLAVEHVEIYVK